MSTESNSEKLVSYQKKDGCGHARPSCFWHDNDLKVCFLVARVVWHWLQRTVSFTDYIVRIGRASSANLSFGTTMTKIVRDMFLLHAEISRTWFEQMRFFVGHLWRAHQCYDMLISHMTRSWSLNLSFEWLAEWHGNCALIKWYVSGKYHHLTLNTVLSL